MNRTVVIFTAFMALAPCLAAGSFTAHAELPPPGTPCSFTLSPPHVVPSPDGDVVTATVAPAGCMGPFSPRLSVVCIQRSDSTPQCSQGRGSGTAAVFTSYEPGANYTSTGRGLGAVFNDASEPNWQLLGPITGVL
jgi:hypothetical protein